MKIQDVKLVDESELQDLIERVYGRRTEFVAEHEMSNGSMKRYTVPSTKWLDDDDDEVFARWVAGDESIVFGPDMQVILNDLNAKGRIPAGEYVIHVWW